MVTDVANSPSEWHLAQGRSAAALLPCDVPRFFFETDAAEPCPVDLGGPGGMRRDALRDIVVHLVAIGKSDQVDD